MKKIFVLIVVLLLVQVADCEAQKNSKLLDYRKADLPTLIENWKTVDGEAFIGLSLATSKKLVEQDSLFFELMYDHPDVYHIWKRTLQGGTFTAWRVQTEVDKILQETLLLKLKELMIESVNKYMKDLKYQIMAREIKLLLDNIEIIHL